MARTNNKATSVAPVKPTAVGIVAHTSTVRANGLIDYHVPVSSFGTVVINLSNTLPKIVKDEETETTQIEMSRKAIAYQLHSIPGFDAYLKYISGLFNDAHKTAAAIDRFWSKVMACLELDIEAEQYAKGQVLNEGYIAQSDGYRYNIVAVRITDDDLAAKFSPLDDDDLNLLGF